MFLTKWFKESEYYYSEKENELAEDDDELFDKLCSKGEKFNNEFIESILKISLELHDKGIIKNVFGTSLPIIIHKLEYNHKPANWTKKGNPNGIADEFIDWGENM